MGGLFSSDKKKGQKGRGKAPDRKNSGGNQRSSRGMGNQRSSSGLKDKGSPRKSGEGEVTKSKSRIDNVDEAILKMKMNRDKLEIYKKKLEKLIRTDKDKAKTAMKEANKQLALIKIKQSKHHEKMVDSTENALTTLRNLIDNTEMAKVSADVIKAMETGNNAMKKIQAECSTDYAQKVMDEAADGQQYAKELDSLMREMNLTDDDLLTELSELENQVADKAMQQVQAQVTPVPTTPMPEVEKKEEVASPDDVKVEEEAPLCGEKKKKEKKNRKAEAEPVPA